MGAPRSSSSTPSSGAPEGFPWVGLLILSTAVFVSVTSEFLPTGLMPDIAQSLRVSESQVGLLVTVFAGTVVLTAAPLTALTRRYSRKYLVVLVLVVFALSNGLSAIATSYEMLLGSRVIGGFAHGLFWAVVGAYSAHLVPKHRIGRAVAITSGGGTVAFVLGVPLGTALGHAVGWRLAFGVVGIIMLLLTALVIALLPPVDHHEKLATGEIPLPLRKDPTVIAAAIVCVITVVVILAHNLMYTYIAPFLIDIAGFSADSVPLLLFLYGGAGAVGLVLAGIVGDKYPRAGLLVGISLVAASVLVIGLVPQQTWVVIVAIVIWGMAFGGVPALLQTRMLHAASPRIRDIASAYLTTAFNLAIGGGALLGGWMLDSYGLGTLPFGDVSLMLLGIVVILVTTVYLDRRSGASNSSNPHRSHR